MHGCDKAVFLFQVNADMMNVGLPAFVWGKHDREGRETHPWPHSRWSHQFRVPGQLKPAPSVLHWKRIPSWLPRTGTGAFKKNKKLTSAFRGFKNKNIFILLSKNIFIF
jgi:hypothetical protein